MRRQAADTDRDRNGTWKRVFAAVQKHVAVLERAGLVTKQARGREPIVRGEFETVRAASQLLDHYEQIWRVRVARMDDLLGPSPQE